ncbi:hypothetical protein VPH35_091365 [Triticum aestivum]
MAGDSNDAIPRDVLASVLLRFPASDLRRFRRVCKEWCEVISDPAFIDAHTIHGPRPLTHTIVFFLGRKGGEADEAIEPRSGDGYLFDEHWRLVARFTAGESENMVGTCNGLLCFLDFHQADIRVVEPFTGESLVLPPPETQRRCEPTAYCFGFDPSSRRYKILHQGRDLHKERAHAAATGPYDGPVFADGSAWSVGTDQHQLAKVVRFDLATEEEITSEPIELADSGAASPEMTTGSDARVYVVYWRRAGTEVLFMGECGRWAQHSSAVRAPRMRFPAWPHPLQRGHLLLQDFDWESRRGVYAHPITPASNDLGAGKLLLDMPKDWPGADGTPRCDNARWLFVPVPLEEETAARVRRAPPEKGPAIARVFCYAPPVSPPSLARYFEGLPKL